MTTQTLNQRRAPALLLILVALLATACVAPAPAPASTEQGSSSPESTTAESTTAEAAEPASTNLTDSCVQNYDPEVDYFPEKTTVEYGETWQIEYFNHYKVVTLLNPWRDAEETLQYVLVQCGTPAPEDYGDAAVVEVPIDSIITMASTQLPHLLKLDRLDALAGHSEFMYINTPEVRDKIETGNLVEVGEGAEVNVELAIETDPDLITTFAVGIPEYDAHPKLMEAGLDVAVNAEYMETSPLGRVEWLKYTAAFFNEEARAESVMAEIAAQYEEAAALAADVTERPTVFTGISRGDSWNLPGGESYVAQFIADAGGQYLWADDPSTGSISVQRDFETVYATAAEADYWLNTSSWESMDDVLAADARYAGFAAFRNGNIYNNNARVNENGGNDYWESGLANPHVILQDLVKIFHPDLLPDHSLVYYQNLE